VDWYRVLGVAPDVHYEEVGKATEQSRLTLYMPYGAMGYRTMGLLARASGPAEAFVNPVRALMTRRFPGVPVYEVMTLQERRRFVTWENQFFGEMMGVFAILIRRNLRGSWLLRWRQPVERTKRAAVREADSGPDVGGPVAGWR